jgi:hypothetical protein
MLVLNRSAIVVKAKNLFWISSTQSIPAAVILPSSN